MNNNYNSPKKEGNPTNKDHTPAGIVFKTEEEVKAIRTIFDSLKYINPEQQERTANIEKLDKLMAQSSKVSGNFEEYLNWMKAEKINKDEEEVKKITEIYNSIHMLKGSFAQIADMCENLKDPNFSEHDFNEYVENIIESIQNSEIALENLKKDKIEEIKLEDIVLVEYTREIIGMLEKQAKAKNVNIHNNITDNVKVLADKSHLESVLVNLISNAIKFTNSGGNITLSCEQAGNSVKIYVEDEGVGIPKDKQINFFDNLGNTTAGTRGERGTGVGMYTVGQFIKEMNGTISVESEIEKGTKFTITLPAGENGSENK